MEQVCRVCMGSSATLIDILADQRQPSLASMFKEFVDYANTFENELPKKICDLCICDLQTAFNFKRRCQTSYLVLRAQLLEARALNANVERPEVNIKFEPEDLISSEDQNDVFIQEEFIAECQTISSTKNKESNNEMYTICETKLNHSPDDKVISSLSNTQKGQLMCTYCTKTFKRGAQLSEHIRTHTGERPFKCPKCPKSFIQPSHLRAHINMHSQDGFQKCPHCTRAFTRHSDLQYHIFTHSHKNVHGCTLCTRRFTNLHDLVEHMRCHKVTQEGSFDGQLDRHARTDTAESLFKCPHCPKLCTDKGSLARHIAFHTSKRPHKCPQCHKVFTRAAYLQLHISTHTDKSQYHVIYKDLNG